MLLNQLGLPECDDLQHLEAGIHKLEWYADMYMTMSPAYIKVETTEKGDLKIVSVAMQIHLL